MSKCGQLRDQGAKEAEESAKKKGVVEGGGSREASEVLTGQGTQNQIYDFLRLNNGVVRIGSNRVRKKVRPCLRL